MSVSSCFWALLSLENFTYVYLPDFITDTQIAFGKTTADILLQQSLLDFIHPDEFAMAQTDLLNFVKIKTLAGAVTRCRLKSIKSILNQQYGHEDMDGQDWIATDVVMYTATNRTILTFFHCHDSINKEVCYGSRQANEPTTILKILALHPMSLSADDPMRIFQIYNTDSKSLIISWPNTLDEITTNLAVTFTRQEMDKRVDHPLIKTDTACTHHSHSNSTRPVSPYGTCQIERIVITYGCLTFSSFQITPVVETTIRAYHHHMNMTSRKLKPPPQQQQQQQQQIIRKSNINHILNETHEQHHYIPKEASKSPSPKAWRGRFGAYEKKCENCQTSTSPEWRRGPSGHKTLCNACGLRYARLVAKHERSQGKEEVKQPLKRLE